MHTLKVYILKRLLQSIPLILFAMAINFVIIHDQRYDHASQADEGEMILALARRQEIQEHHHRRRDGEG